MQENLPPDNPNGQPSGEPERPTQPRRREVSVRPYPCLRLGASIFINIGWMVAVSHSDIFGKNGVIPAVRETQIKVFKRPPPPPPKRKKPPPPPPPPKQQPHVKPPPPLLIHHSPPPPPMPHMQQVRVATTRNALATPTFTVPDAPPPTQPIGPAEPSPITTPPTPPSPPVVVPPAPPPPVVVPPAPRRRSWCRRLRRLHPHRPSPSRRRIGMSRSRWLGVSGTSPCPRSILAPSA